MQQQQQQQPVGSELERRGDRGYEVASISIPIMRAIPDKAISINFRLGVERGYSTGGSTEPYSPVMDQDPENILHQPDNINGASFNSSPVASAAAVEPRIHLSPTNERDSKSSQ